MRGFDQSLSAIHTGAWSLVFSQPRTCRVTSAPVSLLASGSLNKMELRRDRIAMLVAGFVGMIEHVEQSVVVNFAQRSLVFRSYFDAHGSPFWVSCSTGGGSSPVAP